MKKKIIESLKWLWQLPQNILAIVLKYGLYKYNSELFLFKNKKVIVNQILPSSVSLGEYIFIAKKVNKNILLHEYGHSIQSMYLGPLYLFIIGIPSFIHAFIYLILNKYIKWDYYKFYTEKWANKLVKDEKVGRIKFQRKAVIY